MFSLRRAVVISERTFKPGLVYGTVVFSCPPPSRSRFRCTYSAGLETEGRSLWEVVPLLGRRGWMCL